LVAAAIPWFWSRIARKPARNVRSSLRNEELAPVSGTSAANPIGSARKLAALDRLGTQLAMPAADVCARAKHTPTLSRKFRPFTEGLETCLPVQCRYM
jgi:hypothetical protein